MSATSVSSNSRGWHLPKVHSKAICSRLKIAIPAPVSDPKFHSPTYYACCPPNCNFVFGESGSGVE